ncbi:hypothetical protein J2769_000978 [Acinetobacter guillouiae]|nr:hypothetical protein [Acinetobacter guillouiae]BAP36444.1 hypothetical protein AS4_15040 [Acinetobacter guillouiae]
MKKTHFKLVLIFSLSAIAGCTTNDVNSPLVRFWNDGFIMTEKKQVNLLTVLFKLIEFKQEMN